MVYAKVPNNMLQLNSFLNLKIVIILYFQKQYQCHPFLQNILSLPGI